MTSRVKRRKAGKCSWCGEAIEVGHRFCWWPSVDGDGRPNGSCSMHLECDAVFHKSWRETFTKYEFERGSLRSKGARP
jgi:hypothetical protein